MLIVVVVVVVIVVFDLVIASCLPDAMLPDLMAVLFACSYYAALMQ